MRRSAQAGELAIVLHTHMPYVEGFGTWPFGEEWLWEAIVGSYLPLLDLLDEGAPLTLSLTPVLCDQLEAPGTPERFEAFVRDVRGRTHREDIEGLRRKGFESLARELERSWDEYEYALRRFRERDGELVRAFAPYAQWTSSATHAVLPLLASDAGVRAQVQAGVASHRARFGERWAGGFWLPECAHAPHLEPLLEDAGVRATCVELTSRQGLGSRDCLRVLMGESGVALVPIDRLTISRVWSEQGYPSHGAYRDYHNHTVHHHKPWGNDGEAYNHERALATARSHAADFVSSVIERLRSAGGSTSKGESLPGGGLVVCALDTELLGHWWYEGVHWLRAVVQESDRQGLALVPLDQAAAMRDPALLDNADWAPSTWGNDGDLSTWSGPKVANMAFAMRAAELQTLAAGAQAADAAIRELFALQASDWAFMVSRDLAVPYARERFEGHRERLYRSLSGLAGDAELRNLAPCAASSVLLGP